MFVYGIGDLEASTKGNQVADLEIKVSLISEVLLELTCVQITSLDSIEIVLRNSAWSSWSWRDRSSDTKGIADASKILVVHRE